jgi:hypothetical protein
MNSFKNIYQQFNRLVTLLMVIFFVFTLSSCSDRIQAATPFEKEFIPLAKQEGKLAEVSPPPVIQELNKTLQKYQPQVKIIAPKPETIINETSVKVQLKVKDFPLFKNEEKQMGPHLHLILDNEPYRAIYNLDQPIIIDNLTPGSHTLRVFPVKPWHESFKNNGAYAQTTFHILTKTQDNTPDAQTPLLTYSRPTGVYGAEPIMLDFYLTNTPLHLVAQENPEDEVTDWRVKVTINGQTFLLDTWQPIYLKGFNEGNNWVKLEYIDETGSEVKNVFNNTVRLIKYEPNGKDTLSKIVRGELNIDQLKDIVYPTYIPKPIELPIKPQEVITPVEIETQTPPKVEEETEIKEIDNPQTDLELPQETSPTIETPVENNPQENPEITEEITPDQEESIKAEDPVNLQETSPETTEELILQETEKQELIEQENSSPNTINTENLVSPSITIEAENNPSKIEIKDNKDSAENENQQDLIKSITNFWNNLVAK